MGAAAMGLPAKDQQRMGWGHICHFGDQRVSSEMRRWAFRGPHFALQIQSPPPDQDFGAQKTGSGPNPPNRARPDAQAQEGEETVLTHVAPYNQLFDLFPSQI